MKRFCTSSADVFGRQRLLVLLIAAPVLSGCGSPSPNQVAGDYADQMQKIAAELEAINSQADVDAAATRIESLLQQSEALNQKAAQLESNGKQKLDAAVQARLKEVSSRIQAAVSRLQSAGLLTGGVQSALDQAALAQRAFVASAKAGGLPEPASPLEQCYFDLIKTYQRMTAVLASIDTAASAQRHAEEVGRLMDEEYAVWVRLAELGAKRPPRDVPEKYRDQFQAANLQREQHDLRVSGSSDQELVKVLTAVAAEHRRDREDPFRVDTAIRAAGRQNTATVTLVDHQSLQGPRHQWMLRMLKKQAGAKNAQAVIDGPTYRVVLSPVNDFNAFVKRVSLGKVSDVDVAAQSFTLTIDPATVPDDVAGVNDPTAPPGLPPGVPPGRGRPGPDQSSRGGPRLGNPRPGGSPPEARDKTLHVKVSYDNDKGAEELKRQLESALGELPEYVPGSLELDEATKTVRFQSRGRFDIPDFARSLREVNFGVIKINASPKKPD